MQVGNANYENDLIVQIYLSAAEDYVAALINNDLVEQMINRKFLESGSFEIKPETGKYIAEQLPVEVRIAENTCSSLLASKETEMYLNQRKVVVWILKMLVAIKYSSLFEVKSKKPVGGGKPVFYLVKKGV